MDSLNNLSRRKFIQSAAALSFVYLPGIGRVKAKPFSSESSDDYTGRLCYNENPLGPSPFALTDADHLANTIALNDEAKSFLRTRFIKLGLDFIDSETNFMMFNTGTDAENIVSSGVYIINLIQGEFAASSRVTLLK